MFGRSLRRSYREELTLPADLDLRGLEVTRDFLHRTVRPHPLPLLLLRRRGPLNGERVTVETTGRITLQCAALPRVLAVVGPAEQVTVVRLEIRARRRNSVSVAWRANGASRATIAGSSPVWALGVKAVLQQFIDQRQFEVPEPRPPAGWHRRQWLEGLSAEVAGGITVAALLALVATLWSALT